MATANQSSSTILWIFTCGAMLIMALRLIMRKLQKKRFEVSDYFTMACMLFLLVRTVINQVVIILGTNSVTEAFRSSYKFTADDIYQREVGSKLIVIGRLFYNSYIWLQKVIVMCLYKRFLSSVRWADMAMKLNWAILAATYVAIQVVTVAECRPFYIYWQVVPDPGTCVKALLQLFVLGALNIFTDVILIALPMPTLVKLKFSLVRRIQLILLFSVGILVIAVTIVRLPQNYANLNGQISRITWGSVEVFAAALVANAPIIYGLRSRTPPPSTPLNDLGIVGTSYVEIHDQKSATTLSQDEYLDASDNQMSRKIVVRLREDGSNNGGLRPAPALEV